jgi:hypothetical protein
MTYYERENAYTALLGENPNVLAIVAPLGDEDRKLLTQRLEREATPLQAKLKVLNAALEALKPEQSG